MDELFGHAPSFRPVTDDILKRVQDLRLSRRKDLTEMTRPEFELMRIRYDDVVAMPTTSGWSVKYLRNALPVIIEDVRLVDYTESKEAFIFQGVVSTAFTLPDMPLPISEQRAAVIRVNKNPSSPPDPVLPPLVTGGEDGEDE